METTEGNCGEDPEFDAKGECSKEASGKHSFLYFFSSIQIN